MASSDPPSILDCWTQHFTNVSNPNVSAALNDLNNLHRLSRMNRDNIVDDEVTIEEAALGRLESGKACGVDGLQSEHLKYGGPLLILWL